MSFQTIYRLSFYTMLTFATLVMSMDATDENPLSHIYPIVVAIASMFAITTVDRNSKLGLARDTANVLALGTMGLVYLEYKYDNNLLLLAVGHWLVYLQLIKMFLPKSVEDDWFLFLLGLMQVLVGAVMSQSDRVGMALFCWIILAIWVLGLFSLRRDADREKSAEGTSVQPMFDKQEPYPGLFDPAFLLAALRVAGATLALGGIIFLAMPRRSVMGTSKRGDTTAKHLTGFDDEVKLGQLGEILENDSVVMTIELSDEKGERVVPDEDILWRGVTLTHYERGHWTRPRSMGGSFAVDFNRKRRGIQRKTIRQQIKLEPTDNRVLFGLRPMLDASAKNRLAPDIMQADGTLVRVQDARLGGLDYEVISSNDEDPVQPGEAFPNELRLATLIGRGTADRRVIAMPESLRTQLAAIAEPVVASIPAENWTARAKALESYLRDSGRFSYSLVMTDVDPSLDPVVDFLVNRKSGHCEYFASGLALLLRSIDIPARVVNGFKGGDWNDLARMLIVRQKHAHSWVEALSPPETRISEQGERLPIWITLDPTPSSERAASVAKVGGFGGNFREVGDFIRYIWVFYIVGYNADRQNMLLYEPARQLAAEAQRGFLLIAQSLREAKEWLFRFPDFQSVFSIRGGVVSFVLLVTLAILFRIVRWFCRKIYRWMRGQQVTDPAQAIGVAFYRRLAQLLKEYGQERSSAETPQEFAHRASLFLSGAGMNTAEVADVPPLIVNAFYKIRFGNQEIGTELLASVEARLEALERSLRPAARA